MTLQAASALRSSRQSGRATTTTYSTPYDGLNIRRCIEHDSIVSLSHQGDANQYAYAGDSRYLPRPLMGSAKRELVQGYQGDLKNTASRCAALSYLKPFGTGRPLVLIAEISVGVWLMIAAIVICNIGSIVVLEHVFPTSDNRPRYIREIAVNVVLVVVGFVIYWLFNSVR